MLEPFISPQRGDIAVLVKYGKIVKMCSFD